MVSLLVVFASLVACALSTPLDDYVNKPDSHYTWFDTVRFGLLWLLIFRVKDFLVLDTRDIFLT
jgi:hypothetical protein